MLVTRGYASAAIALLVAAAVSSTSAFTHKCMFLVVSFLFELEALGLMT